MFTSTFTGSVSCFCNELLPLSGEAMMVCSVQSEIEDWPGLGERAAVCQHIPALIQLLESRSFKREGIGPPLYGFFQIEDRYLR